MLSECVVLLCVSTELIVESKGLVPEGYVKFLTSDEERQYLSQNPPTNILLPQPQFPPTNHIRDPSTGEETPTLRTWSHPSQQQWRIEEESHGSEGEWIDGPNHERKYAADEVLVDSVTEGIEKVNVER